MFSTLTEVTESHNAQVSPEFRVLAPGLVIDGNEVIACTRLTEYLIGDSYSSWVALFRGPDGKYHDYIVWTVVAWPDGWVREHGSYYQDRDEAWEKYEYRGGR